MIGSTALIAGIDIHTHSPEILLKPFMMRKFSWEVEFVILYIFIWEINLKSYWVAIQC
jgi:hypothetical protein